MKKILSLFLIICLLIPLTACAGSGKNNEKLKIVTSLFPHYDFARQIVGDKADVSLLLSPGTESHTFDPSAIDIYNITSSDIFIYTGNNMEAWAERVISSLDENGPKVVDASSGIELLKNDEHSHDGDEHDHVYDPHIWLNPLNAVKMLDNILEAICEADPENEAFYRENAKRYRDEIILLDNDIERTINRAKEGSGDTLVFGGKFAYIYFFERYNVNYKSAYKTCSTETEPSLTTIYEIVQFVKDKRICCIFKEELSEGKVANSIAEQTGTEVKVFSTVHNVTKSEFESGATYVSIMYQNLNAIERALMDSNH